MATPSQLAANAKNAKKSTGPKTPEGKAKSSKNALKHGLRAEEVVLRSLEFDEDWEAHLQAFIEDTQPVGDAEFKLAETAAMCLWKKARAAMMLTLAQDTQIESNAAELIEKRQDPDVAIEDRPAIARRLKGMLCSAINGEGPRCHEAIREAWLRIDLTDPKIAAYFRYYNSFERGFFRAFRELEKRRIERKNDGIRAEKRDFERWKVNMKAPSSPTLAMLLTQFEKDYSDSDLAFLLKEGFFEDEERVAALQLQRNRLRKKALAEHRANELAEAELARQAQAAKSTSEHAPEFENDSALPWERKPQLYKYPEVEAAAMTAEAHVEKIGPVLDGQSVAQELGSNGQGAETTSQQAQGPALPTRTTDHGPPATDPDLASFGQETQIACESDTYVESNGSELGAGRGDALSSSPSGPDPCTANDSARLISTDAGPSSPFPCMANPTGGQGQGLAPTTEENADSLS